MSVTGRHHPKLLAVLLLEAGRVVTGTRLVEALWEHEPPATARRQIQNTLASLRRQLAGPGAPAIEATGEGYRIVVPIEAVDAQRFAELARQGREARERDDPATASLRFAEALDLWRGEALAGLSGRVVEAAVLRLNESRLSTLEDRCEVDIALGRHGLVIGELRELLEHHPYRQRIAGLLMTALHHNGRTPEALEVYTVLRARLNTELGLDPGPGLARLHGGILRGDLSAPHTAEARPAAGRPAQLPADTTTFTGRRQHLTALDDLLDGGRTAAVVSAIAGMGGAGKTALAVHWAHRVRNRFGDGQLYIDLRGYDDGPPVAPADALARFLNALGQPGSAIPADVDEAGAMYRSLLADRNMLILLDNARDAAQVRPLLPGGAGNFALVTSRDRLTSLAALDDAAPVRLNVLDHDESLELLARLLGTARLRGEPEAADRLAQLCGHLPLALRIAGAHLVNRPDTRLSDFTAELATGDRLAQLQVAGDAQAAVSATIDLSFKTLSNGGRELFARLGQYPGDGFSSELIAYVSNQDPKVARKFLDELDSAHLVERQRTNRYRFHDLIRDFARDHAEPQLDTTTRSQIRSRFINWYFERRTSLGAEEMTNVIEGCRAWSSYCQIWRLAVCSVSFVDTAVNMAELFPAVEHTLEKAAKSDDPVQLSLVNDAIARLHRARGNRVAVVEYGRKTVAAASRLPHGDSTGEYRSFLASRLVEIGRNSEAQSLLRHALRDVTGPNSASLHRALGSVCRVMGEYAVAEHELEMAWRHRTSQPGDMFAQAVHTDRALLFRDMGRHDEALGEINETLTVARRENQLHHEIIARLARAKIHYRAGDLTAAKVDAKTAFDMASESSRASLTQAGRFVLAELAIADGRPNEAARSMAFVESQNAFQNDPILAADLARVSCDAHNGLNNFDSAVEYGVRAEQVYAEMPYPLMQAQVQSALGDAYQRLGRASDALVIRNKALDIFTRLQVPEAQSLRKLLSLKH